MSTAETNTSRPTIQSRNIPAYLTPEQILAQIPSGVHTTLNPRQAKITQRDMDLINEIIQQYMTRNRKDTGKDKPDNRNRQENEYGQ